MAFGTGDRPGRLMVSPRDFARFGLLYLRGGKWRDRQLLAPELARIAISSPLPNSIPRTSGEEAQMIEGQRSIGSLKVPDNQCDHLRLQPPLVNVGRPTVDGTGPTPRMMPTGPSVTVGRERWWSSRASTRSSELERRERESREAENQAPAAA
jgi:CubicO group peptidase (beta-lactamase class C family)